MRMAIIQQNYMPELTLACAINVRARGRMSWRSTKMALPLSVIHLIVRPGVEIEWNILLSQIVQCVGEQAE